MKLSEICVLAVTLLLLGAGVRSCRIAESNERAEWHRYRLNHHCWVERGPTWYDSATAWRCDEGLQYRLNN